MTQVAYRQVAEFGMNPRIGHISLPLRGTQPFSKSIYSQKLTKKIDEVCSYLFTKMVVVVVVDVVVV